jgi:Rieske Fe-S protein
MDREPPSLRSKPGPATRPGASPPTSCGSPWGTRNYDECTHAAASLADGMIDGDVIECCMHMGSFHIPTGKVMQPPCEVPLRTYQVVLKDEDVFADLKRNAAGEP